MKHRYWMLAAGLTLLAGVAHGIALGLLDDFNDDTTQGWVHSPVSPNPPVVIPLGGPDNSQYLENFSSGNFGPGGRHIIRNEDPRWTGDYIAAGVNQVRVNIANFGSEPLPMRLAFQRIGLDCWASTEAHVVPADAVWRNYEFIIDESTMTNVFETPFSFEDALRDVEEIRVVAAAEPACMGDQIMAVSGYDDFQTTADSDNDGVTDDIDNCTNAVNPNQNDADGDGYGNLCDADFDNNCFTTFPDLALMQAAFFTNEPEFDLDGNGFVTFPDLAIMQGLFFLPPGPSASGLCNP